MAFVPSDGNPATDGDPAREPLAATANHPEHTVATPVSPEAVTRAPATFLGTERRHGPAPTPPTHTGFERCSRAMHAVRST